MADDSDLTIAQLMKLTHAALKEECRRANLPVSGTKLILATRVKVFYDNIESTNSNQEGEGQVMLNQSIIDLENQIALLDQRIHLVKLESDIGALHAKRCETQSTPIPKSRHEPIIATSREPNVTYRRPKPKPAPRLSLSNSRGENYVVHSNPDSHLSLDNTNTDDHNTCTSSTTPTNPNSSDNSRAHASNVNSNCLNHASLSATLAYAFQASKMPTPEPEVFSGQVLKYNDWNKSFRRFIDSNPTFTPSDKLFYLSKYTGGEVADIVHGYYTLDDDNAYDVIRDIIHNRYGHPHKISQAFQKRLSEWPNIPANDALALQKFSDFLINCKTAMQTLPNLSFLNHSQENSKLKQLLPAWLKRKWNTEAITYSNNNMDQFPPFEVFAAFIKEQSELLNHPIATEGEQEFSLTVGQAKRQGNRNVQVIHNASVNPELDKPNLKVNTISSDSVRTCKLCKGEHMLYRCDKFKLMKVADRYSFVNNNELCINCLNTNHGKKSCALRLFCRFCSKSVGHNALLHDALIKSDSKVYQNDNSKPDDTNVSKAASLSCHYATRSNTSMVVPVYVSHEDNPNHEVLTYAMLDTQSQITFITDSIAQSLTKSDQTVSMELSTMTSVNERVNSNRYRKLIVRGYNQQAKIMLDKSYGCTDIPNNHQIPSIYDLKQWPHLAKVADEFPPVFDCGIGLLIGYDNHYASFPIDKVPNLPLSNNFSVPYAIRTVLGWSMVGPVSPIINPPNEVSESGNGNKEPFLNSQVHRVAANISIAKATAVPIDVVRQLEKGFDLPGDNDQSVNSIDDVEFLSLLKTSIKQDIEGVYSMPLPFRGGNPPQFPNNKSQARLRLKSLERKFKDATIYEKYNHFMNELLESGDAEPVPLEQLNMENKWYIPHHFVTNPKKPNKFRIVFDASCKYQGTSLNQTLLSGPNLNNSLVGVLVRFREKEVAIACDIAKMFYCFKVEASHRDFLRFLWYDSNYNIKEYRMTKHIFGATSSPGCSKYGLLQIAKDYGKTRASARWFIENCFYVDDGLYSCTTEQEAITLLSDTRDICSFGGLKVHKIMSNSKEVLRAFPESDLTCDLTQCVGGVLGSERALGVEWNPSSDKLFFKVPLDSVGLSRREMLRFIASIFDPLGLIAPIILNGKRILQRSCNGLDWDEPLPADVSNLWESWISDLRDLDMVLVPRCLRTPGYNSSETRVEIHTFADASENGYGACSYLRIVGTHGLLSCSLIFGKSRVVPLKGSTIPRLELQASVLAAKVGSQLIKELSIDIHAQYYWTDSKIVLAYLHNSQKKLKQYVRNRVLLIRELTKIDNWFHVRSQDNPADIASRGCSVKQLVESCWFHGPPVLNDPSSRMDMYQSNVPDFDIPDNDKEVQVIRESVVVSHCVVADPLSEVILDSIDRLGKLSAAIKFVSIVLYTKETHWKGKWNPSVEILQTAEFYLIRMIQSVYFKVEIEALTRGKAIPASSSLVKLDPILDNKGNLRVGGRTKFSCLLEAERHPVIIPKDTTMTRLIIRHFHEKCAHQGRGITMSCIRAAGYWIVNLTSAVSSYIHTCVSCRKLRRSTEYQKMSDLPSSRVNPSPPFSFVGLDCFGPFEVKDGRKYKKRYGVIFSCLYSRAVHVEICDDLSSDGFINCFRTFIALRGQVRQVFCDRGTNFVGAANELAKSLKELETMKLFLEQAKCEFVFNSPSASHMGGVWERQIRTFRNVLNGVVLHTEGLDSSSIRTVFYECMNIMNNRPLTTIEPDGLEALTPNHLIQMKSSIVLPPPPGQFPSPEQ